MVLTVIVLEVIAFSVVGYFRTRAQGPNPPGAHFATKQNAGPQSVGVRIEPPSPQDQPLISQEAAVEKAKAFYGGQPPATTDEITVSYVLFNDDETETVDSQGKHLLYQDVLAYIVSFHGTYLLGSGPRNAPPDSHVYNTEINIVINAMTGELMEEYSWR